MHLLLLISLAVPCVLGLPIYPVAIPDGSCGMTKYMFNNDTESENVVPYIVGGHDTKANAYPWQVSLQVYGQAACGGSIISDQYILTAAHCFDEMKKASQWRVVAGKHVIDRNEQGQKTLKIAQIIVHKKYSSLTFQNDIALLKLTTKIQFDQNIQPICLPPGDIGDLVDVMGTITGWGDLFEGGYGPDTLQETEVPIITNAECQEKYPDDIVFPSQLCAGFEEGGKDTCQGDSGGPMVILHEGKYIQIGVTSNGIGCAQPHIPGMYTRVSSFLDWIGSNMKP